MPDEPKVKALSERIAHSGITLYRDPDEDDVESLNIKLRGWSKEVAALESEIARLKQMCSDYESECRDNMEEIAKMEQQLAVERDLREVNETALKWEIASLKENARVCDCVMNGPIYAPKINCPHCTNGVRFDKK